jgi:hypothetical protein
MEEMRLDNYMEEKVMEDIFTLLAPIPFEQLPTISDFLGD